MRKTIIRDRARMMMSSRLMVLAFRRADSFSEMRKAFSCRWASIKICLSELASFSLKIESLTAM